MTEPIWRNSALPAAARAEALLAEMTLEEKVAQLGSAWPGNEQLNGNVAPMQDVFARGGVPFEQARENGIGHLTRVFGTAPVSAAEGAARVEALQREIVEETRLGIPAIVHEECLTGFTTYGATVYPAALAWAATFDPELVERMASAIADDMRNCGVHQGLSPVLDVVRDYRWGRVEETLGEDPYLVGTLGAAYVRGLERNGIIATLKHFAGYSASRAARNHAPVSIGPRELRDVILPPFEMAIREGGARSVMNAYVDLDGVPAAANVPLLTGILRDEWGFEGVVVSDYWAIAFLGSMHRVADSTGQAGALALAAGIDVELPDTLCYGKELVELVRSGEVPESLVDRAAGRLLRQKAELGLLDADWAPRARPVDLDSPRNRAIARELAEKSVVLLSNDGELPLRAKRIAVVGPCADDPLAFMGCYSYPNHVLPRYPGHGIGVAAPSLLESLRAELPDAVITSAAGCPIRDEDRSGFAEAVEAARDADVCIAVVGDRAGLFGEGTSGEGCDAPDLRLPGVQDELLTELLATGTPVVVVVVSGRPYALGNHTGAAALVQAFMPGEEGGPALAAVLSGRTNFGGRLPVQVPRVAGAQPSTYLQPPLGGNSEGISNLDPSPLFPFGHGLSYTTFEYSDLAVSTREVPTDGEVEVSVRVRNTGDRAGDEVVQLYVRDVLAQVTRPVRQLAGFARITLAAGESRTVVFRLHADRLAFTGLDLRRIVEPGTIEVFAGRSAGDLPCHATFELTGPVREAGPDRVLTTPVHSPGDTSPVS
ncbi:glycoside hydrolase family 3 C-terminal domain-containing protein [Amycolatopsis thermalba]|uniref:Glycoside hydrolase family 3 C-terminal domain-containing protein n=1 Tax=Amycolatopsis thermalba TaxID=944492 RepID=A0ABY4P2C4_9PSEU|nr:MULTISPECIES: glycoside hydrolase family 3 N-terminal domain-containing protein [Amycolatopsis]UQS26510.1 glycoside hydrolase family 3 C-terminal domain-containing protein [Amycolatopsis thermalba]